MERHLLTYNFITSIYKILVLAAVCQLICQLSRAKLAYVFLQGSVYFYIESHPNRSGVSFFV